MSKISLYSARKMRKKKHLYYYDFKSGMMRKYTEMETRKKENDGRPLYCASSLIIKSGAK